MRDERNPDEYAGRGGDSAAPLRERPAPWSVPPDGLHFVAVEQTDWIIPPIGAGRCRYVVGPSRTSCKRPAVASLMRGHGGKQAPWDYCEEHLYGRWVEDGKVLGWRLVPNDE